MANLKIMKMSFLLAVGTHAHPAADLKRNASRLDPNRILCPVLAALYNAGDLKTDEFGSIELQGMQDALHYGTGCGDSFSKFQANGIADFDLHNKEQELVRDRCIPGITISGTKCAAARAVGSKSDEYKRWLNIFTMNGKQVLEHGISTGTRGGATNVPDPELCGGVFPCEARFQKFYVQNADENGRLYRKNLLNGVVCSARKFGDRGGEYSYSSGSIHLPGGGDLIPVPAREWQMKGAIQGWLNAFGRRDEKGEWYLTIDDARAMVMEGRYPDGWKKRDWGCLVTGCEDPFLTQTRAKVECDVGEKEPWWGSEDLKIATGEKCHLWCNGGATCVEGTCICGRDKDGMGMVVKQGKCVRREQKCEYFGEKCSFVPATNPTALGNPKAEETTNYTIV
jgi:hypothetical protein